MTGDGTCSCACDSRLTAVRGRSERRARMVRAAADSEPTAEPQPRSVTAHFSCIRTLFLFADWRSPPGPVAAPRQSDGQPKLFWRQKEKRKKKVHSERAKRVTVKPHRRAAPCQWRHAARRRGGRVRRGTRAAGGSAAAARESGDRCRTAWAQAERSDAATRSEP